MFVLAWDWKTPDAPATAELRQAVSQIDSHLRRHPPDVLHVPGLHAGRMTMTAVFRSRRDVDAFLQGPVATLGRIGADCRQHVHHLGELDVVHDPLVIVSAPRSGSTLLFELCETLPQASSIGGESYHVIDAMPELGLRQRGFRSHALTYDDGTPEIVAALRVGFAAGLRDRDQRFAFGATGAVELHASRLVEKTPRNCLRVGFMRRVFPDARFVFLVREPRGAISSIMETWRRAAAGSGLNLELPNWPGGESWPPGRWHGLLPPGWEALARSSLVDVAAFKWAEANNHMLAAMEHLPRDRWLAVRFDDVVDRPLDAMSQVCEFAGFEFDSRARERSTPPLAPSASVVSQPYAGKWRRDEADLARVLPRLHRVTERLEAVVGSLDAA